jgi:hypothetical protein
MKPLLFLLLLLPLACNRDRPQAPTREQSDQLNAAEAMLDEEGNSASNH